MSESQYISNAAQPPELAHQPPLMLPQTPLSPLAFSPGLPEYSPAYTLMPGFSIPPFSPLNSPLVPQQFLFPTSPPPFSPGPAVGGGGDFCHVCGPPAAQLCAAAALPMQPPQAPIPGCWGAYQQLPPLSPLSPSINTSVFPPMSLNCPPPPLFSPLQPPPPPAPVSQQGCGRLQTQDQVQGLINRSLSSTRRSRGSPSSAARQAPLSFR